MPKALPIPLKPQYDYNPFGMIIPGRSWEAGSGKGYRFGFGGKENLNEVFGDSKAIDFGARTFNTLTGIWNSIDPMFKRRSWVSPYNYCQNDPINRADPNGAIDDWVKKNSTNDVSWDENANDQSTTKEGYTYIGKSLVFTFNSFIDGVNWDGPNPWLGPSPVGDKLTSTLTITGSENADGELTKLTARKSIVIGDTPWGKARDYYPGLDGDQNKFAFNSTQFNATGELISTTLNFEQHASVSEFEEMGMRLEGYNIVNVAQKLQINYSNGNLTITTYTDIFPSASLSLNGTQIMYYHQPSFKETHALPKKISSYSPPSLKDNAIGCQPIYDTSYKPAMWYKR